MIEVYDWLEASESPGTVSADSMLYGIGCMNHKLLILIDKMRGLIPELGKIKSDDLPRYLSTFDKKPFGINVDMLKKIYDREGISFSGMEQVIKDRNYFIHDFKVQKGASYKKEAQRLYNLINNIHSLTNQVTGVTQKVVKDNTKKKGTEKAKLIRKIDKLIKEHSSGDYLPELSYICLLLESDGCCFWKKHHAAEAFENLGYQIVPWPENNNILLICPRSKN